ncbi:acyl-CoA dehydrogenase family protein [Mycolicibacterium komossense]|uniref:Acyl-CoA dehydrogenase family protein n=1 Tax=Mycolicibacterium komossense TaxID=1779 RepID=A0ABT3CFW4_9MYCO|nr:acyl-CoA dehydrogenase family protein [Mycolicibacterium komossense]MCV7228390.1 acyl-CoA dehydrogenase family protein [Mycolicibacterium komossense]
MDFDLSDEQGLLRDVTREALTRKYDIETRIKVGDTDLGWSRDVWSQLAEIGILGLGFDPDEAGQIELMVVLTEIGRRLAPEPVVAAALIPGSVIAELGDAEQAAVLEAVAEGKTLLALAHQEPGMRGLSTKVTTQAERQGDSWTLTGVKNPVLAGDSADAFVVSAALPDGGVGLFLVDADSVSRQPFRTFDSQRGAQVSLEAATAQPLGAGGDATAQLQNALIRYQSALCAEAVGAMEEALRLTTEYLTSRKQFGVPLSNFQTLTQRAADMYVSLELARSMNFYAAMSIADGNFDPVIAARAKLQISRSGRHIAQEAIQLHGGIGVTAEYPVSHYAARLTAINQTLGSADDQLHTLINAIGSYGTVSL